MPPSNGSQIACVAVPNTPMVGSFFVRGISTSACATSLLPRLSGLSPALGETDAVVPRELLGQPRDGQSQGDPLPLAPELHVDVATDWRLSHEAGQRTEGRDIFAVELEDDVARLDAGLGGWTPRVDARHKRARLGAGCARHLLRGALDLGAEPATADLRFDRFEIATGLPECQNMDVIRINRRRSCPNIDARVGR
jgi:hypothetical protein